MANCKKNIKTYENVSFYIPQHQFHFKSSITKLRCFSSFKSYSIHNNICNVYDWINEILFQEHFASKHKPHLDSKGQYLHLSIWQQNLVIRTVSLSQLTYGYMRHSYMCKDNGHHLTSEWNMPPRVPCVSNSLLCFPWTCVGLTKQ